MTLLRRERCELVDDEVRLDVGSHARICGSVTADGREVRCVLGGHGVDQRADQTGATGPHREETGAMLSTATTFSTDTPSTGTAVSEFVRLPLLSLVSSRRT